MLSMENYGKTYAEMLKAASQYKGRITRCNTLCAFWPRVGEKFKKGEGLMIIGKAPYGEETEFSLEKLRSMIDYIDAANEVYEYAKKDGFQLLERYDSPFWQVSKEVTRKLFQLSEKQDNWYDYIAWSNLYKIAPQVTQGQKKGNPPDSLAELVREKSIELLKIEIRELAPSKIWVCASWDWFQHFSKALGLNIARSSKGLIEAFIQQNSMNWVITKHPQASGLGTVKEKTEQILLAFNSMNR